MCIRDSHPREQQQLDEKGIINFDLLDSIDHQLFADDINKLILGHPLVKQKYLFNNPLAKAEQFTVHPAPVILIEGLFVFHLEKIRDLMDLRIFIHANDELKIQRRIKRDAEERNYPLEDVLYRYENHVLPSYKAYIEPHKEDAHLVVNNNDNYEQAYQVLHSFLKNKIEKLIIEPKS